MRHDLVTRAVLALTALLLLASLLFARLVAPVPQSDPAAEEAERGDGVQCTGAELFRTSCAGCHDAADLVELLEESDSRAEAAAGFLELLRDHGRTSDPEDVAILDHLARRAWERGR